MTLSKIPVHAINKRAFKSVKRSCSLLKSMAERGETYQTSGGECSAVRYGLSDSRLRLAAYGPIPTRRPPPEWGWAGKRGALLFSQV